MEPEGSSSRSQEVVTVHYPEPDASNPPLPTLCPICAHVFRMFSFLQVFWQILYVIRPLMRAICPAHLITLNLIALLYMVKRTSYEVPHYAVFSILPPLPPS